MKRTAVVHFESAITKEQRQNPDCKFDKSFYYSPTFTARANSTLRLNVVNYNALRNLSHRNPIDIFAYQEIRGDIDFLLDYEQIVVNIIASAHTKNLLEALIPKLDGLTNPPELILGTEYSWLNRVRDGSLSETFVNSIYRDHLMLRHTSKTDRHVYEASHLRGARIQEFPLGIDVHSLPTPLPITERKDILFVAAPEGRSTKNNDEIQDIIAALRERSLDNSLHIRVLKPPYATPEYWEALRTARYLVFTSVGETFSYVLNDAAAMGTIVIRRPELFATRTSSFGADSYWDVGLRYQTAMEACDLISAISADENRLRRESYRARAICRKRFSIDAVERNWHLLLEGENLNTANMLVADISLLPGGLDEAFDRARTLDCKIVLSYMSKGLDGADLTSYSALDPSGDIAAVPFCYKEIGSRIRVVSPDLTNGRIVSETDPDTMIDYLRLLVRVNGISTAYVEESVSDAKFIEALSHVTYLNGRELAPLHLQQI